MRGNEDNIYCADSGLLDLLHFDAVHGSHHRYKLWCQLSAGVLCFTEVVMHGSSGFRIVEELRRRNRRAKTVLIAQDKDYALEALRVG